jgi:hypothetical protein
VTEDRCLPRSHAPAPRAAVPLHGAIVTPTPWIEPLPRPVQYVMRVRGTDGPEVVYRLFARTFEDANAIVEQDYIRHFGLEPRVLEGQSAEVSRIRALSLSRLKRG